MSVIPGTKTCLIQIRLLLSLKYFANSNSSLLENPVNHVHVLSLIDFISSKNISVSSITCLILSVNGIIPAVSIQVDIPAL